MNECLLHFTTNYSSVNDLILMSRVCKQWNTHAFLKLYQNFKKENFTLDLKVQFIRNDRIVRTKHLMIDRKITLKQLTMYIISLFKSYSWQLINGSKNYYSSKNIFLVCPIGLTRQLIPREDTPFDEFFWFRKWNSNHVVFVESNEESFFCSSKSVGKIYYLKKQIQRSTLSTIFFRSNSVLNDDLYLFLKR